jgi:large subunit ribosomal protein L35
MPKMKTRTNIKKRVKITGTGALRRRKAFRSHLLEKKSARRRRRLGRDAEFAPGQAKRIRRQLPGA